MAGFFLMLLIKTKAWQPLSLTSRMTADGRGSLRNSCDRSPRCCVRVFSLCLLCACFLTPSRHLRQLLTLSAVLQTLPSLTDKQGWRDGSAVKAALAQDPSIATTHVAADHHL